MCSSCMQQLLYVQALVYGPAYLRVALTVTAACRWCARLPGKA
jgi:hypothetical protein